MAEPPVVEGPTFRKDVDPVAGLTSYLREHQAGRSVLLIVGVLLLVLLANYPTAQAERDEMQAMLDAAPIDAEPVDAEDRAAIAEAQNDASFMPLARVSQHVN